MTHNTRIISVANQKGGVGKTTTAINLAAGLCSAGKQVLLIDMDPQGNASTGMGVPLSDRQVTAYDVLLGDVDPSDAMVPTPVDGLSLIAATTDLSSADLELSAIEKRVFLLRDALQTPEFLSEEFDYVIIDCPPSLNLLTINAFVASTSILIPLQTEFYALEGLSQLMLTVRDIRETANTALRVEGVVLTMYDGRNRLARQVELDARDNLGDLVFQTVIPRNVRLSEAPSFAMSILEYDPTSKGGEAYMALANELIQKHKQI